MRLLHNNSARRVFVIIVAAAMSALPLVACDSQQKSLSAQNQVAQTSSESNDGVASGNSTEGKEANTISTPIGDLTCPANWDNDVQVADSASSDSGSIVFLGTVNNEQVKLFSLGFGDDAQGYVLGTVPDSSGTPVRITLDISEIESGSDWSDDDVSRMNNLQEGVNDLLDQIYQRDGFVSSSNQ